MFAATPWNDIITDWVSQNIRNWYMHIPVYIDKSGSTGESGMAHEKYGATPGANMYNTDRQDGRTVIIAGSGIGSDMWFGWLEYYGIVSP